MSTVRGTVGSRKIEWKRISGGAEGTGVVEVDGRAYDVSWRKDGDGFWIEFPHRVAGFDLAAERDEVEGLLFRVQERGGPALHQDQRFRRAGEAAAGSASGQKRAVRVRAQMPGKIVRVLVQAGDAVEKDQPLLVMEAMKMENEIRAPQAGQIGSIQVAPGQAVETGADLIRMA